MTKKKDSPFKVNMNSEDVIVAGGTRRVFLNYHNKLQTMVKDIEETKDVTLSQVRVLEDLIHELHSSLQFVPQKNEDDTPNHWGDYVLSSDDRAWHPMWKYK